MKKIPTEVEAFWSVPWNTKLWANIEVVGRSLVTDKGLKTFSVGPILDDLPRSLNVFVFYCTVENSKPRGRIFCHFEIRQKPSGKTPKWVMEQNQALGGKDGLNKLLASALKQETILAKFEIGATIPRKGGWKCRLLHKNIPADEEIIDRLGKAGEREQVGYRFEKGVLGMDELTILYDHIDDNYRLDVEATAPLRITPELTFPIVDQLIEFIVPTCFVKQRGKS